MTVKIGRRPRLGPSREALAETRAYLGRWTSLRFDLDKLDPDEQSDLVRLCRQATTGARRAPARSASGTRRWSPLVDDACLSWPKASKGLLVSWTPK
jgi:hypothetical protein